MTDILTSLLTIRRAQSDTRTLIRLPWGLYDKTNQTLNDLEKQAKEIQVQNGSMENLQEITKAYTALTEALQDIIQSRADIIWSLAYDQTGDPAAMTPKEQEFYSRLCDLAAQLKGVQS